MRIGPLWIGRDAPDDPLDWPADEPTLPAVALAPAGAPVALMSPEDAVAKFYALVTFPWRTGWQIAGITIHNALELAEEFRPAA